MKRYTERAWLNKESSHSTGSIVVFDGDHAWSGGEKHNREQYIEVSDCHGKVRLHRVYEDSMDDFKAKVRTMIDVLSRFLDHLNTTKEE